MKFYWLFFQKTNFKNFQNTLNISLPRPPDTVNTKKYAEAHQLLKKRLSTL